MQTTQTTEPINLRGDALSFAVSEDYNRCKLLTDDRLQEIVRDYESRENLFRVAGSPEDVASRAASLVLAERREDRAMQQEREQKREAAIMRGDIAPLLDPLLSGLGLAGPNQTQGTLDAGMQKLRAAKLIASAFAYARITLAISEYQGAQTLELTHVLGDMHTRATTNTLLAAMLRIAQNRLAPFAVVKNHGVEDGKIVLRFTFGDLSNLPAELPITKKDTNE